MTSKSKSQERASNHCKLSKANAKASSSNQACNKLLKSRKKPFVICAAVLVLELIFLNVYPTGLEKPVLLLLFFIFSICSSSIVIVGFTMTKELFPVEIAGTSVGTVNLFPFLGGAVFMPVLGQVLDAYPLTAAGGYSLAGYRTLLMFLLAASVVALICTFFMRETFSA